MFKIETGRKSFHQWDVNQRLIIDDPLITEVHFANTPAGEALVVEVYEEGGKRYANVPNILLQNAWTMRVYGCCEDCVRRRAVFQVVGREKPADYVYTETEVRSYEALADRIKALEEDDGPSVDAEARERIARLSEEKADYFEVGDGLTMSADRVLSAAGDGVWELIEETILTETVTKFARNEEPDGTPYNYKAVVVRANFANVIVDYSELTYGFLANGYSIYCYRASKLIPKTHSIWASVDNSGYTPVVNCCIANNVGSSMVDTFTGLINRTYTDTNYQSKLIKDITLQGAFPEGVKISVWGVRA